MKPKSQTKNQYGPSFETSRFEHEIINRLADRAVALAARYKVDYDKMTAIMDLTACHANGCELDLSKLAAADDANFGHDAFGIRRHINRATGQLEDCFSPRCALVYSIPAKATA